MTSEIKPTKANGYFHGRPEDRNVLPLDELIEAIITSLPAETRLYPDVYSWKITDAILNELGINK